MNYCPGQSLFCFSIYFYYIRNSPLFVLSPQTVEKIIATNIIVKKVLIVLCTLLYGSITPSSEAASALRTCLRNKSLEMLLNC